VSYLAVVQRKRSPRTSHDHIRPRRGGHNGHLRGQAQYELVQPSGLGDPELTALGHDQAAAAAARLAVPDVGGLAPDGIAAVLTSPLRRARQTAAAVADALGTAMEERKALVETDFGGWEGLTFAEARERDPELHAAWLGDERAAPPGGESFAAVVPSKLSTHNASPPATSRCTGSATPGHGHKRKSETYTAGLTFFSTVPSRPRMVSWPPTLL